MQYDLVEIRKYLGAVDGGQHVWKILGYAIVIKTGDFKAVCMRDQNIEYEYLKLEPNLGGYSHEGINVGDVRIASFPDLTFRKMRLKNKWTLERYMRQKTTLDFDDDTRYGRQINPKIAKVKTIGTIHRKK